MRIRIRIRIRIRNPGRIKYFFYNFWPLKVWSGSESGSRISLIRIQWIWTRNTETNAYKNVQKNTWNFNRRKCRKPHPTSADRAWRSWGLPLAPCWPPPSPSPCCVGAAAGTGHTETPSSTPSFQQCCGFGSVSQSYGSRSGSCPGSFYQQK